MKRRPNQSQFAILGMLTLCPMSGYDLRQQSQTSIGHFWREGYGQIYPTLNALESSGLATCETEEQAGRPDRHVYSITSEGRRCLAKWLDQPVGDEVPRNEILLKLFFGRNAGADTNLLHVGKYQALHKKLLTIYEQTEQLLKKQHRSHPDLAYWLITLNYGRHRSQAVLHWCDQTATALRKLETKSKSAKKIDAKKIKAR